MSHDRPNLTILAVPLLERARPPCLPPRRRPISPEVAARLRAWTRSALGVSSSSAPVRLLEWTSNDPRGAATHRVVIVVKRQRLCFDQASERLTESDISKALREMRPTSGRRPTAVDAPAAARP